jgi:hypothetical protein
MSRFRRAAREIMVVGLALLGTGSCVDPFRPDFVPRSGGSGGESAGGSGEGGAGGLPPSGGMVGTEGLPPARDASVAIADAAAGPGEAPDAAAADRSVVLPPDAASAAPDRFVLALDTEPAVAQECPEDPPVPDGGEETCPANLKEVDGWLPVTPPVVGCKPPAHPETECRFYQFSWQNFLVATQPEAGGKPAFLSWGTIENVFGAGAGQPAPEIPFLGGGVTQAGGRQVLIDQKGHAIHYGMHMNRGFVDFVNARGLQSAEAVRAADPLLEFPPGVVELKSAWQIVDDNAPPANYITAKVRVPSLSVVNNQVVEDDTKPRTVTVALLALHVVFTLPGHPEFVWSTFQHVDAQGITDVAPSALANPQATPAATVISRTNGALFRGNTTAANGNRGIPNLMFDPATQTFPGQQTSIYRMFPGSKSNTTDLDDDVTSINEIMRARFARANLPASDRRGNYLLVGAIWQDRPDRSFALNKLLVNDDTIPDIIKNGGDSPQSITGGEDRLSSTAMESFTQAATAFPNCFSCHDTRAATARGVPAPRDQTAPVTMQPKMLNISHIFNEVSRRNP